MSRPTRRSTARTALGLVAAIAIALPGALPATAAPTPGDGTSAAGAGAQGGSGAEMRPSGVLEPSAQYLDSVAHAGDHIAFQPGDRVTVPFQPRGGDTWTVDGGRARSLPAGRLSGRQMRDASDGPDAAAGSDPGAGAVSSGTSGADADVGATGSPPQAETVAAVSPTGLHRAVLGFLPYWEVSDSTTTLDYPTLSTVAYFSVGCASGGSLLKKNSDGSTTTGWAGWTSSKMTAIINAAHTHGTRVALTLSCFGWSTAGANLQAKILTSSTYRNTLASQTAKAVHDRGADGVNLDFEPLVSGTEAGFVAFIRALRSDLDAYAHGYELTFDTMGYIGNYPIENATAPGAADALMIMGYDYRSMGTSTVGSISPLTGPPYDLNDTISAYTKRVSPSKIILGLPYYGRAWSTDSSAIHARNISGTKYGSSVNVTYATAVGFAADHGRKWDPIEQAPWTEYQKQTCTTTYGCVTSWRQLYYDDVQSLAARYDMINRRALRGAGIWALGYDSTRPELHDLLADKFLRDTTPPVAGVTNLGPTQVDEGFRVAWKAYDDTGVATYDVQVSRDAGAWATWLTDTTATADVFLGTNGHAYAFRVRATDGLGNSSAWYDATLGSLPAPSALGIGTYGRVATASLHMRAAADTSATAMTTLTRGATVYITGGPRTADGYAWYRVNGPINQWSPVDFTQLGGWVAVRSATSTYVVPRAAPYATRVAAGITDYAVGGGGDRVVTPNGDGVNDTVRVDWTNAVAMDSLTLRVFGSDGSLVGSRALTKLTAGPQTLWWDGTLGGPPVPAGNYVLQLVGMNGTTTYSAPSASPATDVQLTTFGVAVAPIPPTSVFSFGSTTSSPTRSTSFAYKLVFGGAVTGLSISDFARTGTATGCVVGHLTGSGASYALSVSNCSAGTVTLAVKANTVRDGVGNIGPDATSAARTMVIDRTAPRTGTPLTGLRSGVLLSWTAIAGRLGWSASDAGGAGIATYDVERSVDGAAFAVIATGLASPALNVSFTPGHTYRYAVRAHDRAGNVGSWKASSTTSVVVRQESTSQIVYGSGWHTATSSHFSGGAVRYATTPGAALRYTFTGRAIAFVTTLAASRGAVKVYLDGTYVTSLDLGSATTAYRSVAWQRRFSSAGTHTLRLVLVGTPGRPRVDVDAFVVLR